VANTVYNQKASSSAQMVTAPQFGDIFISNINSDDESLKVNSQ
jgi:hypothetical protein